MNQSAPHQKQYWSVLDQQKGGEVRGGNPVVRQPD